MLSSSFSSSLRHCLLWSCDMQRYFRIKVFLGDYCELVIIYEIERMHWLTRLISGFSEVTWKDALNDQLSAVSLPYRLCSWSALCFILVLTSKVSLSLLTSEDLCRWLFFLTQQFPNNWHRDFFNWWHLVFLAGMLQMWSTACS